MNNSINQSPVYDVIVIGGSYAGMAASLQLARARRQVLISTPVSAATVLPTAPTAFWGRTANLRRLSPARPGPSYSITPAYTGWNQA